MGEATAPPVLSLRCYAVVRVAEGHPVDHGRHAGRTSVELAAAFIAGLGPVTRADWVIPTGFWRMSGHPAVQQALRNHYFDSLGLPRLHVPIQLEKSGLFGCFFERLPTTGDAWHKGLARLAL